MISMNDERMNKTYVHHSYFIVHDSIENIMLNPDILIEEDVLVEDSIGTGEVAHLIVFNDDYNSFEWVIESFVKVCKHTEQQAEQLSLMIHFKGKATVKTAEMPIVRPMKDALIDRGLSAHIETEDA